MRTRGWTRAGAVSVFFVALLIGAIIASGCGSGSDAQTSGSGSGRTEAVLKPVDGSKASGRVLVVRTKPSQANRFEVSLEGLKPNAEGGQYVLWLMGSRDNMLPLYTYPVHRDGKLDQAWVPDPIYIVPLERGEKDEFLVTRANTAAEVRRTSSGGGTPYNPPFIGEPVLRGAFVGPIVGSKTQG